MTCLAWSADGLVLASGEDQTAEQGGVKVWDMKEGKLMRELAGHRDRVHALVFAPDGSSLASGGRDGKTDNTPESEYTVTSFEPTDYDQDIMWADGFFVRWPQKAGV